MVSLLALFVSEAIDFVTTQVVELLLVVGWFPFHLPFSFTFLFPSINVAGCRVIDNSLRCRRTQVSS